MLRGTSVPLTLRALFCFFVWGWKGQQNLGLKWKIPIPEEMGIIFCILCLYPFTQPGNTWLIEVSCIPGGKGLGWSQWMISWKKRHRKTFLVRWQLKLLHWIFPVWFLACPPKNTKFLRIGLAMKSWCALGLWYSWSMMGIVSDVGFQKDFCR